MCIFLVGLRFAFVLWDIPVDCLVLERMQRGVPNVEASLTDLCPPNIAGSVSCVCGVWVCA